MQTVKQLVDLYQLLPHPEGGYYKETYRSTFMVNKTALPDSFTSDKSVSTAIYFLLEKGNFSAFHRIKSDECWHFYAGETLHIYVINPQGELSIIQLGNQFEKGEVFQAVVPANCWFASEPAPNSNFSFVGCTVAPGFDFEDFEMAKAAELAAIFPQHTSIIQRLCR
ncbi:MAG: cupin domain-containing protein [Chitinophagaceae bacterium]